MVDGDPVRLDLFDQIEHTVQSIDIGLGGGDLGADVAVNALNAQALQGAGVLIKRQRLFMGNTKLVVLQAGGDVGVGFGVNIGVDANADGRHPTQFQRHGVDDFKLGRALDVEAQNPCFQGAGNFSPGFAHTRKNHVLSQSARCQDPVQLTLRDHIKTTTGPSKELQNSQVGVGLHGVVHARTTTGKTELVALQGLEHGALGVSKEGCAQLLDQVRERHAFEMQLTLGVVQLRCTRQRRVGVDEAFGGLWLAGRGVHGAAFGVTVGLGASCSGEWAGEDDEEDKGVDLGADMGTGWISGQAGAGGMYKGPR